MLIGRGEEVDIVITDPAVSHDHARVTRRGDGYYLIDLGSRNGTLLNGVLIEERRLRKRDRIQIGETTMVFLEEGAQESTMTISVPRQARVPIESVRSDTIQNQGRVADALAEQGDETPIIDLVRKVVAVARFIRRNAWLLIPLPLIGLGLGAYSMKVLPAPATAAASVKLSHDRASNPVDSRFGYDPRREPSAFFDEPEKNFANADLVRSALQSMDITADEVMVGAAHGGLKIEREPAAPTGVYLASFSQASDSPFSSVGFLEQYLEAYLLHEVDSSIRLLRSEAGFMESELQDVETELHDLEAQLLEYRNRHINSLPEQADAVLSGKLAFAQQKADLEIQVERARVQVANARQQLGQSDSVVARRVEDLKPLKQDLAAKQRTLSDLKAQGLKADHPDVRKLSTQISMLDGEIERKLNSKVSDLERTTDPRHIELSRALQQYSGDLRVAEGALAKINQQLAGAASNAAAVPEVDATIRRLVLKQESLQKLRSQLFEKHREKLVQIDLETANVRSRYEIVAPAAFLDPVTRRFLILRLGGGFGAGLALALALTALVELRRLLRRHPELLLAG
jgi:hypothetical protein